MYKLGFKEAEESNIKLPTFTESWRKQGNSRKTSTSASLTTLNPLTVWITPEILKVKGVPDHFTCLLRNLYAGQEATQTQTMDWFKTGSGVGQGCTVSLCLFNLYAEYIMGNARLHRSQAGIKIAGRNINNLRCRDDTTLMAESKEDLKSLLRTVKEEREKLA